MLDKSYVSGGIELEGTEIGVHQESDGTPFLIFGTQFLAAVPVNEPVIGTAKKAWEVAQTSVNTWPGFDPGDPVTWSSELISEQIAVTRLLLHPSGDGTSFRFEWRVPTLDRDRQPHAVTLDAATGEVLLVTSASLDGDCGPDETASVSAVADPQNPAVANRSLWATELTLLEQAPLPRDQFQYEAHRPGTFNQIPEIELYMGYGAGLCSGKDIALVPIKEVSGAPLYTDYTDPIVVPGKAAGDALYFTYLTMRTFKNTFNRYSYDNSGATARVVVDAENAWRDNGEFVIPDFPKDYAQTWSAVFYKKSARSYSFSACLDVVAHEWGHGAVETAANFPYSGVGAQLHEGFADFFGHSIERLNQPVGSGAEKADWKLAEDNGVIWRRVDVDDGTGGATYHKDDDPGVTEAHARGNMLAVAFRLLADSGQNPVCSRLPNLSGCSTTVPGQGLYKASKIFYSMLLYSTSSTAWEDLPDLGKLAAYRLFNTCKSDGGHAGIEQGAVINAFQAIGYQPSDPLDITCP